MSKNTKLKKYKVTLKVPTLCYSINVYCNSKKEAPMIARQIPNQNTTIIAVEEVKCNKKLNN